MKATDLLKAQHKNAQTLFDQIEDAGARQERVVSFEKLARNLVAHDAIEREIFYPACELDMGMTDLLCAALAEHGLVEFSLYEASQALSHDNFDFKMTALREVVEHHVKEEEREFFLMIEKALGTDHLNELGVRMKIRFEEVNGNDFRKPLYANLAEVLAAALPRSKGNAKKRRPARRPARAAKRPT